MAPHQARRHLAKYGPWAIVTGSSSGIGACFARRLAEGGFNLVLVARRESRLQELAKDVEAATEGKVLTRIVVADLSCDEGVQKTLSSTEDLDVGLLVNNAGIEQVGSLWREPPENHQRHVALNCTAPLLLTYGIVNRMLLKKRPGGVINISSCSAAAPSRITPLYSAGKAFLTTLGVGLNDQLEGTGIDILTCQPGQTESEMIDRGLGLFDSKGLMKPIPADECVDETLAALGSSAVVNTGVMSKAVVFLSWILPRWFSKRYLEGSIIARARDPTMFEPRAWTA